MFELCFHRHLVLNKDVQEKAANKSKKQDKIRYQYDEHYFLTDPSNVIVSLHVKLIFFILFSLRHLVLNKDVQEKAANKSKKQDKIRYQYDEHYFLTDPDEFIQEFWAQDPEWQVRY